MQTPQINPGAFEPVVMDGFARGWEHGQQTREQNMAKAAYAALVRDPSNQKAFEALASANPEAAQQFKQQQLEQAKAHLGAHYKSVMKGAQLIRQMQPKDDAGWQQVLMTAHQAGIDVSEVPPHFDQQYVSNVLSLADTFAPQTQHQSRIITPQPGAGAYELGPDGSMKTLIEPNDGSHQFGTAAGPPQGAVEHLRANPGLAAAFDEKYGAGASAQVLGGQAATPPATFPRSY